MGGVVAQQLEGVRAFRRDDLDGRIARMFLREELSFVADTL